MDCCEPGRVANAKLIGRNQPIEQAGTRLMFENERVRVWDLTLAANGWKRTFTAMTFSLS